MNRLLTIRRNPADKTYDYILYLNYLFENILCLYICICKYNINRKSLLDFC